MLFRSAVEDIAILYWRLTRCHSAAPGLLTESNPPHLVLPGLTRDPFPSSVIPGLTRDPFNCGVPRNEPNPRDRVGGGLVSPPAVAPETNPPPRGRSGSLEPDKETARTMKTDETNPTRRSGSEERTLRETRHDQHLEPTRNEPTPGDPPTPGPTCICQTNPIPETNPTPALLRRYESETRHELDRAVARLARLQLPRLLSLAETNPPRPS